MLGQKLAGHLIDRRAEARHGDLLAAFELLKRFDVLGGVEPIERAGVENHQDF